MKHQSTLFENSIRVKPLKYKEYKKVVIKTEREYLTKSGCVITVVKKTANIGGVGDKVYYQINDRGLIIEPFTPKGVLNYIKTK